MMTFSFIAIHWRIPPKNITNLTSAALAIYQSYMEKETHTRFIHRRGWKGRREKNEGGEEDQRHLQAPGWVPTLGYIWCCGWNKKAGGESQAGWQGGVGVWPKTKKGGLIYMKCVCVCLGYVHYIQSYVIWTIQRFNAKCICPRPPINRSGPMPRWSWYSFTFYPHSDKTLQFRKSISNTWWPSFFLSLSLFWEREGRAVTDLLPCTLWQQQYVVQPPPHSLHPHLKWICRIYRNRGCPTRGWVRWVCRNRCLHAVGSTMWRRCCNRRPRDRRMRPMPRLKRPDWEAFAVNSTNRPGAAR